MSIKPPRLLARVVTERSNASPDMASAIAYFAGVASNANNLFWSLAPFSNSHSQITTTRHPAFLSIDTFFLSLSTFPENFVNQKFTLLFGA